MTIKTLLQHAFPIVRTKECTVMPPEQYEAQCFWEGDSLRVCITNTGNHIVSVKEIALFAGETGFSPSTPFYGEGFQMLCQYRGTLEAPECIGQYGTDRTFFHFPDTPFNQDLWTVYNLLLLAPCGEDDQLAAFTSCQRFGGEFRFRGGYLEIVMNTEEMLLAPGETWELEEITLLSGNDREALYDAIAKRIALHHPPLHWDGPIPTGWCSYYCLRPMTAEGLYRNARAMKERIPELGRLQIDGGYEAHNGDWLVPNPALGADMPTICSTIRDIGMEPIGYLSPFVVDEQSDVYHEHPDWLITDEENRPDNRIGHKSDWYVLDVTHPEARAYLADIVRVMHDDWGMRYFKLDFLAYGALPGQKRHDSTKTSVEAFRMGMRTITNLVRQDSFILGCNAPFWPQLGLVHANRATNDIYRAWKQVGGNALEQFCHNWQHNRLWINDPDCVLLEPLDFDYISHGIRQIKKSELTPDEFQFHRAVILASGGMILSGDLLDRVSDQSLHVLRLLMRTAGEAAVFDDDSFSIGRIRSKHIICIFNFENTFHTITVPIKEPADAFDFWTGEPLGTFDTCIPLPTLPPHSARVLRLQQAHGKENS